MSTILGARQTGANRKRRMMTIPFLSNRMLLSFLIAAFPLFFAGSPSLFALTASALGNSGEQPAIIVGFTGGFVRHDDLVHGEVEFAARLRSEYPAGTIVETFENHNGDGAYQRIVTLLDTNHDGTLSDGEKHSARIVLYGHSWGGSETVALARRLEKTGVPVLLTVQVDSVEKVGEDDQTIPSNVAQAANFYQSDGLLHGETRIQAADNSRTQILGNFRFRYDGVPYSCVNYQWYARLLMKAHIQIECDPRVWDRVDALIGSTLAGRQMPGAARDD